MLLNVSSELVETLFDHVAHEFFGLGAIRLVLLVAVLRKCCQLLPLKLISLKEAETMVHLESGVAGEHFYLL